MAEVESRIVAEMAAGDWGLAPDVQAEVVDQDELVKRYIDIVAQGDTVVTGGGHLRMGDVLLREVNVSPWGERERRRASCSLTSSDLTEEDFIPKGPLPRKEAEEEVQNRLAAFAKMEAYRKRGRIGRAAQFIKFVLRKDSDYVPTYEQAYPLPDVIRFIDGEDRKVHKVIVSQAAEERAAA